MLLLTGGGEGRWLAGTSDSSVDGLDTASDDFLSGSNDGVELASQLLLRGQIGGRMGKARMKGDSGRGKWRVREEGH